MAFSALFDRFCLSLGMELPAEGEREKDDLYLLEYEEVGLIAIRDLPEKLLAEVTADVAELDE
jgi:hypothetical protein